MTIRLHDAKHEIKKKLIRKEKKKPERLHSDIPSPIPFGMLGVVMRDMIGMVEWLTKKEGGRGPDFLEKRTGHYCGSFSHGMTPQLRQIEHYPDVALPRPLGRSWLVRLNVTVCLGKRLHRTPHRVSSIVLLCVQSFFNQQLSQVLPDVTSPGPFDEGGLLR